MDISEEADMAENGGGGSVRETRLLRVCEKLKQRVDELKKENNQLEELLQTAESKAHGSSSDIERLEDEIAQLQAEKTSLQALVQHTVNNKGEEVNTLHSQLASQSAEITRLQQQINNLEENNASLMADRSNAEQRSFSSLRFELNKVEKQLENERRDHLQSRQEFASRQFSLEQEVSHSTSALSQIQRKLEQKEQQLAQVEQQTALLKGERAQLKVINDQLQEKLLSLDTFYNEQNQQPADQEKQLNELKDEISRLQQQLDESQAELEAERQKGAIPSESQEVELQAKLQESNELLWQKQKQLEQLATDKAALQFQLEREVNSARQEVDQVRKRNKLQQQYQYESIVPMEALGETYMKLANNERVGKAVRASAHFMDIQAQNMVNTFKRHPLLRLLVLLYVVFIHLFIYILIATMQRSAIQAEGEQSLEELNIRQGIRN
eukprot:TRINITY_DN7669_c0_g1_i1.p1 TRINITY_DN7669_c0_g1~~TRINITY_DN7669_c0_g1_i1.p1  ORF type:complete len:440 (-),score=89.73 TRINITY_DN7669_c0_g1_i1:956-2275(-)